MTRALGGAMISHHVDTGTHRVAGYVARREIEIFSAGGLVQPARETH